MKQSKLKKLVEEIVRKPSAPADTYKLARDERRKVEKRLGLKKK